MSTATGGHTGRAIYTGLTATGSSQATALQLAGRGDSVQEVTTVAASTGVLLPPIVLPMRIEVVNQGVSSLSVYPRSGGTIDNGSVNAAVQVAAGKSATYEASSLTNWYSVSSTAGGAGTVSSVTAGTGLAGGTITTTGTVSLAAIADQTVLANTSGGSAAPVSTTLTALIDEAIGNTQGDVLYRGASAWSALAPGSSGQVLASQGAAANPHWTSAGAGTVTSVEFVGDGTVLSSSPSSAVTTSGTIAGTLANAPAYTHLANQTGSSAAPTYAYGLDGIQVLSATSTTLTNTSPSYNVLSNASGNVTAVLPAASTCPGKIFAFAGTSQAHQAFVTLNAADTFQGSAAGATFAIVSSVAQNATVSLVMISGGAANAWYCITNNSFPILALITSSAIGTLLYSLGNNNGTAATAQGTAGQMLQGAGAAVPTWTSTPGSGTAFTSIGTKSVNNSATQTVVNGSAGSYTWSQPEQGSSYKNVVIYLSGYTNASTSAIVFTTAFTQTPIVVANGTSLTISTISASGVTIPAATTQTGFLILAGY